LMYKNNFKIGILALAPMSASAETLPLDALMVTGMAMIAGAEVQAELSRAAALIDRDIAENRGYPND